MKINKKYISKQSLVSKNAKIDKSCKLVGKNKINQNVVIKNNSFLSDAFVDEFTVIENSTIIGAKIGKKVNIGPFARLRPKTIIEDNCKIGNFVEIKESTLKKGTKAGHLAYIGNAEIGENCNIGAGVVFANFNGKTKNKIVLGKNCFIGSNSTLIAPLTLGEGCFVAAGSVVTQDAPDNTLIIGRAHQVNKEDKAHKYLKGSEEWNILARMEFGLKTYIF